MSGLLAGINELRANRTAEFRVDEWLFDFRQCLIESDASVYAIDVVRIFL
jgi:hypothetical protein